MLKLAIPAALAAALLAAPAQAAVIFLDFDTPATGGDLETGALVTDLGTITYLGDFTPAADDPDLLAAGAAGQSASVGQSDGGILGLLTFGFDVVSLEFLFGGDEGSIEFLALDNGGLTVDSFFQADTGDGQPAGPVTLSGAGIRALLWRTEGDDRYAAIDNLTITVDVPEPAALGLLGVGLLGVAAARRRSRARRLEPAGKSHR